MLKGRYANLESMSSHQLCFSFIQLFYFYFYFYFFIKVLDLIPKEEDGELFEDALARIRRCIGGGPAVAAEDSDSDLEVISDSVSVNLRCPVSDGRFLLIFSHPLTACTC